MRVFVISGAGISAESGIPTFRGQNGYWRNLDPAKLATTEAFQRDPKLVWAWYRERRQRIRAAQPNAAHKALVDLAEHARAFLLVTQNVDDLHARAGLPPEKMVQIHGDIFETRCSRCNWRAEHDYEHEHETIPACPKCGALMRPGVVWFGEMLDPRKIDIVENYLGAGACDLVLVIGTTALFGYISDWAGRAQGGRGRLIEINPEETALSRFATERIREPAAVALPNLVQNLRCKRPIAGKQSASPTVVCSHRIGDEREHRLRITNKEMADTSPDRSCISLPVEAMQRFGYRIVDLLAEHFAQMEHGPVGAKADPAQIIPLFDREPSEHGRDPQEILAQLEREVFPNNLHVDHPRFFAFVPGPNNFVSAMADVLAAGFNVFNGTWFGGSAAAALELGLIRWLCRVCGFPADAGGLFVSGGSMANLTALVAARHARLNDRIEGAVVYFSDQTHSSVERALRVIGFAPEQLRKIQSDSEFRLPLAHLRLAIAEDRARGLRPFCIIANAGTTNTGAVDALPALAELAAAENLWLHVDGAFGAAAILSERGRALLQGLERADSITLDPHKWLFQSFECGCVLVRDTLLLKSAFQIKPDYLRDVHRVLEEFNPCDYGVQLTRSFRALKLWLSLETFGLAAFREAIGRGFELAELAERELRARAGWEILSPAQMATVCFRFGSDDELQTRIVDAMLCDCFALLTSTTLQGVTALRLCTINPRTSEEDIINTIERLDGLARQL